MNKPSKPQAKISIKKHVLFEALDFTCKKVSLKYFLDWCQKSIPKKAYDVCFEIVMDEDPFDAFPTAVIKLSWKQDVKNELFSLQMKNYKKDSTKWKKQNVKS